MTKFGKPYTLYKVMCEGQIPSFTTFDGEKYVPLIGSKNVTVDVEEVVNGQYKNYREVSVKVSPLEQRIRALEDWKTKVESYLRKQHDESQFKRMPTVRVDDDEELEAERIASELF